MFSFLAVFVPVCYANVPETYVYVQSNTVTLNGFTNPAYAYNNVTTTGATNTTTVASFWTGYLTLNFTGTVVGTKIRYMAGRSSNSSSLWTTMEITVANQTGSWFTVYSATPTYAAATYFNVTFASSTYTAMRYRFYKSTGTTSRVVTLYETQAVNASYNTATTFTLSDMVKSLSVVSPYIVDRSFSLFESETLLSLSTKTIEKSFALSDTFNLLDFTSFSSEIAQVVGQAYSFIASSIVNMLSLNGFGLERGFTSPNLIQSFSSSTRRSENSFLSSNAINIATLIVKRVENLFSLSASNLINSLPTLRIEKGFLLLNTISLLELPTLSTEIAMGHEYAFFMSSISNLVSSIMKSTENRFVSSNILQTLSNSINGQEKPFSLTELSAVMDNVFSGRENLFSISTSSIVDTFSWSNIENLFQLTETPSLSSQVWNGLETSFSQYDIGSVFSFVEGVGEVILNDPFESPSPFRSYGPTFTIPLTGASFNGLWSPPAISTFNTGLGFEFVNFLVYGKAPQSFIISVVNPNDIPICVNVAYKITSANSTFKTFNQTVILKAHEFSNLNYTEPLPLGKEYNITTTLTYVSQNTGSFFTEIKVLSVTFPQYYLLIRYILFIIITIALIYGSYRLYHFLTYEEETEIES